MNPRTRRVRRVMLDAAIEVLLEEGAHEVTAARVAEHADVARTTVYRQWSDQGSLLLATIDALTVPHHPWSSVGRVADDLHAALRDLRRRLDARDVRSVFGALAGNAAHDAAFGAAQRRFVQQLVKPVMRALEAAQSRGELDPGVDPAFEATMVAGPALHQHLVLRGDVTDLLIDESVNRWLIAHGLT